MKKVFLLLAVVILTATTTFAQDKSGLTFIEGKTVTEAMDIAKKQDKILMMDIYAVWCGPCKRLSADVFPSKDVESLNSKIISYKLNAEEGEGPKYAKEFKVKAYPSLVFFKDGVEVARMVGAPLNPAEFVKAVNEKLANIK